MFAFFQVLGKRLPQVSGVRTSEPSWTRQFFSTSVPVSRESIFMRAFKPVKKTEFPSSMIEELTTDIHALDKKISDLQITLGSVRSRLQELEQEGRPKPNNTLRRLDFIAKRIIAQIKGGSKSLIEISDDEMLFFGRMLRAFGINCEPRFESYSTERYYALFCPRSYTRSSPLPYQFSEAYSEEYNNWLDEFDSQIRQAYGLSEQTDETDRSLGQARVS